MQRKSLRRQPERCDHLEMRRRGKVQKGENEKQQDTEEEEEEEEGHEGEKHMAGVKR